MKFEPKTEKEVEEAGLLPNGIYDFECVKATNEISKIKPDGTGGNEMIVLQHMVFDQNGNGRTIFDYLLGGENMAFKLRHCADCCGLLDKYENGELLADDFVGKTGKLKLKIQKSKDPAYADKNSVQDYIKRQDMVSVTRASGGGTSVIDDEIPF